MNPKDNNPCFNTFLDTVFRGYEQNKHEFKDESDKLSITTPEYKRNRCQHTQIDVDKKLNYVSCRKCGEKLNPIYVLWRMAYEESRWRDDLEALKEQQEKLDKRLRCKC